MNLDLLRSSYRLKQIIAYLAILFVCFLSLFLVAENFDANSVKGNWITTIVSSLTVAGILGLIYESFLRADIVKMHEASSHHVITEIASLSDLGKRHHNKICEMVDLGNFSRDIGLSKVVPNANSYNYSRFLLEEESITIVLNDGRTWVSQHESDIEDRLKNGKLNTTIILVDPDSDFLNSLAKKIKVEPNKLAGKIEETVETLKSYCNDESRLQIYHHHFPTTFSLYMCDSYAGMVTYPLARKADKLPMLIFENTSENAYFHSIKRDVNALLSRSSVVFPEAPLLKA